MTRGASGNRRKDSIPTATARAPGIVDARDVALVRGGADLRVGTCAGAGLTLVGLRAGVAVAARGAVGLGRIRADPRSRVAGASLVALVGRRADDGRGAGAGAGLADVGLRAGAAVVARRAVLLGWVGADPGGW